MSRRCFALLALLVLTVLVYWPGLNGPFILDDVINLDILRVLAGQGELSLANVLHERGGILGGRPVSWSTFLLNWHLAGADVWSFKLVNLLLHLVNGLLVFVVARCLLAIGPAPEWAAAGALVVSGFWLLTPIQVSSVLYAVQRMTLLSAFFCLAGIAAWCVARTRLAGRPHLALALMLGAVILCWPLATLSKQNGALLVPLLACLELLVLAPRVPGGARAGTALLALTGLVIGAGLLRAALDPQWVLDAYLLRDFTLGQRLLTQPRVLFDYALNVLQLPGGSALGLFHDDFQVSRTLVSPMSTLVTGAAWLIVLAMAVGLRRRSVGPALAGIAFFLVAHMLEAGPFALEIYFEHRNYLPSFGIWFAVVSAALLVVGRLPRKRLVAALVAVVLAGHAGLTAARVSVWRSFETLAESNAHAHPDSPRARAAAAIVAFTAGELEPGIAHLDAVHALAGDRAALPVAIKTLVGHCLSGRAPDVDAMGRLQGVPRLVADPYTVAALRWYRSVSSGRDCPGLERVAVARQLARLAESRRDERRFGLDWMLHDELAHVLASAGQRSAARRFLERAIAGAPPSRLAEMEARLRALSAG